VLSGMTRLMVLWLHNNHISDISALSRLTNLRELYLNTNPINELSALSQLTNLRMLYLSGGKIKDDSYNVYIPQIRKNNPALHISYIGE